MNAVVLFNFVTDKSCKCVVVNPYIYQPLRKQSTVYYNSWQRITQITNNYCLWEKTQNLGAAVYLFAIKLPNLTVIYCHSATTSSNTPIFICLLKKVLHYRLSRFRPVIMNHSVYQKAATTLFFRWCYVKKLASYPVVRYFAVVADGERFFRAGTKKLKGLLSRGGEVQLNLRFDKLLAELSKLMKIYIKGAGWGCGGMQPAVPNDRMIENMRNTPPNWKW